ncbi:MAG: SGNH/GDSL hydrolase family protein [Lentisphaeria bacterium]|nr:SGNH/GDSL hydrolase family protein [Lentisphaeria bacterium]
MKRVVSIVSLLLVFVVFAVRGEEPATRKLLVQDGDTVAFLGDSITAGGEEYGGYCRLVIHGLKAHGIYAKGIYAGIPGNKSSDMLLRLDSILRQKPDHLFLSVGVNDVWHTDPTAKIGAYQPDPGMGCELEDFKIYVPRILHTCEAAGTKVILSTFTQITEDPEFRLNQKADSYNAFLRELAKQRGLPIALLNEAAFARIAKIKNPEETGRRNVISSDGIHPVAVGHRVMALGILKTMGLTDAECEALEQTWNASPQVIGVGTRQVTSGGRPGGWYKMLLDILNDGGEMVTTRNVAKLKSNLANLAKDLKAMSGNNRERWMILVPPIEDAREGTPADDYRKSFMSIAESAKRLGAKLIVTTIPMSTNDPESEENRKIAALNTVIRTICKENNLPLADIWAVMGERFSESPGTKLTLGDERFNHEGNMLMVETLCRAMVLKTRPFAEWRKAWDDAESYTFMYTDRVNFSVHLSAGGSKALEEVSNRFHKLEARKILSYGIDRLLHGDGAMERELAFADREWFASGGEGVELKMRHAPGSKNQSRALEKYLEEHTIDSRTFLQRAFKVGLYALRKEDLLGRGGF